MHLIEQEWNIGSHSFLYGSVVGSPQHAYVCGYGVGTGSPTQKIILEGIQPTGGNVCKRDFFASSFKLDDASQRAPIHMCGAVASFCMQMGYKFMHKTNQIVSSLFLFHCFLMLIIIVSFSLFVLLVIFVLIGFG